jgi:hypothetical protein
MKRNIYYQWMALAVILGGPIVTWGSSLTDLGALAGTGLATPGGAGGQQPYLVDVSKDGRLAGSTDSGGNAFIWTATGGKVSISTDGYVLVGVDWYTNGTVLAVANNWGSIVAQTNTVPYYWQGNADGSNGTWTQLPGAGAATSPPGYWFATGLGVASDNSDWWVSGYTTNTSSGNKQQVGYDYLNEPTWPQIVKFSNYGEAGHFPGLFLQASDTGAFVGKEDYGAGSGNYQGHWWQWQPVADGSRPTLMGPPEAGDGTIINRHDICSAGAISGDGTIKGGLDKTDQYIWLALWWDPSGYVYSVPQLFIGGSTYSDWHEIYALNRDGSVMGGLYYRTDADPSDAWYEAFVCCRNGNTIVSTNKIGDLLHAYGIDTNGWVFNNVTAMSCDGSVLAGWGTKPSDGLVHGWIAQTPAPIVRITRITLAGTTVTIDFTSNRIEDNTGFFTVERADTLVNGGTTFMDASPAANFTGSAGSFQATLDSSSGPQFYRIRRL